MIFHNIFYLRSEILGAASASDLNWTRQTAGRCSDVFSVAGAPLSPVTVVRPPGVSVSPPCPQWSPGAPIGGQLTPGHSFTAYLLSRQLSGLCDGDLGLVRVI